MIVSVTAPVDATPGAISGTTIQAQTAQCLKNIRAILEAAGSSMDRVASMTVMLAEEDDFAGMNEEWLRWFPSDPPARLGAKLPARIPGLRVSIAAIAEVALRPAPLSCSEAAASCQVLVGPIRHGSLSGAKATTEEPC